MKQTAIVALAIAGLIHLYISPDHFSHAPAHGIFFALSGAAQLLWAIVAWFRTNRSIYYTGLALSGGMVILWLLTQVWTPPFAEMAEPIDIWAIASKAAEMVGFFALVFFFSRWTTQPDAPRVDRNLFAGLATAVAAGVIFFAGGYAAQPMLPALQHATGAAHDNADGHHDGEVDAHAEEGEVHAEGEDAHAEDEDAHTDGEDAHAEEGEAHAEGEDAHEDAHAEEGEAHAEDEEAHADGPMGAMSDDAMKMANAAIEAGEAGDWETVAKHLGHVIDMTDDADHKAEMVRVLEEIESGNTDHFADEMEAMMDTIPKMGDMASDEATGMMNAAIEAARSGDWELVTTHMNHAIDMSNDDHQKSSLEHLLEEIDEDDPNHFIEKLEEMMTAEEAHSDSERQHEVAEMGAMVMPFELEKTTHIFESKDDGGLQQVIAKDEGDAEQIELIRSHLTEEAARFTSGDFSDPAQIHGNDMPGLSALSADAEHVQVDYSDLPNGAQIRYSSERADLVEAIHHWFAAQLSDHGDDATDHGEQGSIVDPTMHTMTVYKSPTCGCCKNWVTHMQEAGFNVIAKDVNDLSAIKSEQGVPANLQSCHTAVVDGYVIEGHVPADSIMNLLATRPKIDGLAVPGMPIGSPGMEMPGRGVDPFDVLTFSATDPSEIFGSYPQQGEE